MNDAPNPIRSHDADKHEDIPVTERKRVALYIRRLMMKASRASTIQL